MEVVELIIPIIILVFEIFYENKVFKLNGTILFQIKEMKQ